MPRDVQLAAQAFTEVEPNGLRNPELAVRLARQYLAATAAENVTAQITLANALHIAGQVTETQAAARKALSLMAPVRGHRIPYQRHKMEELVK